MKLYHSPMSPYVRKVMVLLHETDQLGDVEVMTVATTPLDPADSLLGKAPLNRIPALERPDGPTLFDSRVICAFLDTRAMAGMYLEEAGRWDVLTLEALADGILDSALAMTYERRFRPEDKQWDDWLDAQWGKIERACAALNQRWMAHLSGPLDMGQIAVACALGYLDLRHDARGWRKGNDALAAWYADFSERPSMIATRPES
ncbi:putative GST-like protein YibF [Ruegeria denitrificans]|uniref:Putative GST-like protein YibF n=1 Tax=Ruegeria denitrificans TaxID=1715692 RepID=A0A0P1IEG6_9RHOB|nr:glutathione S-transferase [Ruegeria denitrificans]CUK08391.1 putative GST-like protein YibF [Ruegeria denitrificans]